MSKDFLTTGITAKGSVVLTQTTASAKMTPGEARDKLAAAQELIKEVETALYPLHNVHMQYRDVTTELVEASEDVDRALEILDEILIGAH